VHDDIHTVLWLFGRGLSLSCGLDWDDLLHCPELSRVEKIQCIKEELNAAMDAPGVNRAPIRDFLQFLSKRTRDRWRHRFLTTNWDFLLQQEIDQFVPDGVPVPRWLGNNSHVFHLNGTVEVRPDNSHRSEFVLREDSERNLSTEVNIALSEMVWGSTFVVVGVSFECKPDKALFNILNSDMLPIGKSNWIIVNPCQTDLDNARDLINCKLPQANVTPVPHTLTDWRETQFLQLKERRIFS